MTLGEILSGNNLQQSTDLIEFLHFSKKTTVQILDNVNKEHDWQILDMKKKTEEMHITETTRRGLKARASAGVPGFALFGDNVGKIVNPRWVIILLSLIY